MYIGYIHTSVHRAPFGGGWVRLSRYILYGLLKKKIVEAALNCSPYIIQMLWDVALTCLTFPKTKSPQNSDVSYSVQWIQRLACPWSSASHTKRQSDHPGSWTKMVRKINQSPSIFHLPSVPRYPLLREDVAQACSSSVRRRRGPYLCIDLQAQCRCYMVQWAQGK